jgi:Imelysin
MQLSTRLRPAAACAAVIVAAAFAAAAHASPGTSVPGANLAPVKQYLLQHTAQLTGFTRDFRAAATRYDTLARRSGYDYFRLALSQRPATAKALASAKTIWVRGNPYYERVEGIVAGTPSLARYDVILDAGSSAKEDPANAAPFDLKLADGRTLRRPGNFYSLTEGMLWGTRTEFTKRRIDLDRDGKVAIGEVLPDAQALKAAADGFDRYARELARAAERWRPTASDAFTAVVVMVPTMTEYFGQWKTSRFVRGDRATGEAFNVVSRLSDIRDILTGLEVIYRGIRPAIAKRDVRQSTLTAKELQGLRSFVQRLYTAERSGRRFTAEQADTLGVQAQDRGTAIAGQVSQAAARLRVKIVQ